MIGRGGHRRERRRRWGESVGVQHFRQLRDVPQRLGRPYLSVFQGDADSRGPGAWKQKKIVPL